MRIDELQQGLASARDEQPSADITAGRRGVDRHVRRQRVERTGLAVLIIVLLAGAGVFLATRGTDEQRVISGPGTVPHYLPDPLPPGSPLLEQLPPPPVSNPYGRVVSTESIALTSDPASYPSSDSQVAILRAVTTENPQAPRPRQVVIGEEQSTAYWVDDEGISFELLSRHMSETDFRGLVASTGVDERGRAVFDMPAGFREVVRELAPYPTGSYGLVAQGVVADVGGPGYAINFDIGRQDEGDSRRASRSMSVAMLPRSSAWLLQTQDLRPTEVRGHPGYRAVLRGVTQSESSDGASGPAESIEVGVLLIWWEQEDLMISVTGGSEAEARDLAESLRVVDDAEWSRFAASAVPLEETGGSDASSGTAVAVVVPTTVP